VDPLAREEACFLAANLPWPSHNPCAQAAGKKWQYRIVTASSQHPQFMWNAGIYNRCQVPAQLFEICRQAFFGCYSNRNLGLIVHHTITQQVSLILGPAKIIAKVWLCTDKRL
jgi:hypothetical protein